MRRLEIALWIAAAGIAGWGCRSHEPMHFSDLIPSGGAAGAPSQLENAAGAPGSAVVDGPLGDEPGQFGVQEAEESMPEAPMSVAASADGKTVYVLDQLNARIQIFADGASEREIPIESQTVEDLAVLDAKTLVLLDRVADRFWVLSDKGASKGSSPITGTAVREAGAVRQMLSRSDGVWIATPQSFVHVLDAKGQPLEPRKVRQGFPSFDGEWLYSVRELGDRSVEVTRRTAKGMPSYKQLHLTFDEKNRLLLWSDLDGEGNLYLAWQDCAGDDGNVAQGMTVVSPALKVLREFELAPDGSARDSYRPFAVSQSGAVFQLDVTDDRVRVRRF